MFCAVFFTVMILNKTQCLATPQKIKNKTKEKSCSAFFSLVISFHLTLPVPPCCLKMFAEIETKTETENETDLTDRGKIKHPEQYVFLTPY